MNMKKLFALGATLVFAVAAFTGCGGQQQAASSSGSGSGSGAGGKIVVGLDDNFPPMGFKDENNEIVGFDIDLAKEATKRLGRSSRPSTGRARKPSSRAAASTSSGTASTSRTSAKKTCCSPTRTWTTARSSS